MTNQYECRNCAKVFNPNNYSFCPSCKAKPLSESVIDGTEVKAPQKFHQYSDSFPEFTSAELEILRAQNRTTYAVRSLAITFVALPIISIAIIFAVIIASATENSILMGSTGTLGVIILISVLVFSLSELAKSKIR